MLKNKRFLKIPHNKRSMTKRHRRNGEFPTAKAGTTWERK